MKEEATALIRKCDRCGMVTALCLDASSDYAKDINVIKGQSVYRVTPTECLDLWPKSGKCVCTSGATTVYPSVKHVYVPPGMSVIGTCSICGGPVAVESPYWSVLAPTPTCLKCGAVKAETFGPVIPMTPIRYNITTTTSSATTASYSVN